MNRTEPPVEPAAGTVAQARPDLVKTEQLPPLTFALVDQARRSGPVWSLGHLKICWSVLLAFGVLLALAGLLAKGGGAAAGAGLGIVIVGLFFTASTVVIAKAGQLSLRLVMPAALGTYVLKIVALGVVMVLIPKDGYLDTKWMAAAVGLGVFAWLGAHMRYVWTAKILYVDDVTPRA